MEILWRLVLLFWVVLASMGALTDDDSTAEQDGGAGQKPPGLLNSHSSVHIAASVASSSDPEATRQVAAAVISEHSAGSNGDEYPVSSEEWVLKLHPQAALSSSYLGWPAWLLGRDDQPAEDHKALDSTANTLAAELDLVNRGRIEPFHGVYRLRLPLKDDLKVRDLDQRTLRRRREVVHKHLAELDEVLSAHPSVLWAARQHPLHRVKKTVTKEPVVFNDPQFEKQWHLVSVKPNIMLIRCRRECGIYLLSEQV